MPARMPASHARAMATFLPNHRPPRPSRALLDPNRRRFSPSLAAEAPACLPARAEDRRRRQIQKEGGHRRRTAEQGRGADDADATARTNRKPASPFPRPYPAACRIPPQPLGMPLPDCRFSELSPSHRTSATDFPPNSTGHRWI
ncbi:hypothetical protein E2562_014746 [Oryza meyeriana var. granulata]|uniref:Uncharacterized protein n=1 Tax=Oryza meyeriana var. granulata TaxID=110450 RepID=A0A6G1BL51_9ORYZ|nr:hypothetical protein E2562_014746 [Oryza meyeriana var. granulata]